MTSGRTIRDYTDAELLAIVADTGSAEGAFATALAALIQRGVLSRKQADSYIEARQ